MVGTNRIAIANLYHESVEINYKMCDVRSAGRKEVMWRKVGPNRYPHITTLNTKQRTNS